MKTKTKQITTKQIADAIELNTEFTIDDLMVRLGKFGVEMDRDAVRERMRRLDRKHKAITRIDTKLVTYKVSDEQYLHLIEIHNNIILYRGLSSGKPSDVAKAAKKAAANKCIEWGARIAGTPGTTVMMKGC